MKEELLELLKKYAYKKGDFTLSSGKKTDHYVNCKPVTLTGRGLTLASMILLSAVEEDSKAVGGLTLGADPLVCGIAQKAYYSGKHIDALIVRKNPKGYGTKEVIEGNKPPKGSVVTVLEDVTTTGSSAIKAVNVLREAGYIVNRVIAIVDRQENHKVWDNNEIEFISLFKLDDIVNT